MSEQPFRAPGDIERLELLERMVNAIESREELRAYESSPQWDDEVDYGPRIEQLTTEINWLAKLDDVLADREDAVAAGEQDRVEAIDRYRTVLDTEYARAAAAHQQQAEHQHEQEVLGERRQWAVGQDRLIQALRDAEAEGIPAIEVNHGTETADELETALTQHVRGQPDLYRDSMLADRLLPEQRDAPTPVEPADRDAVAWDQLTPTAPTADELGFDPAVPRWVREPDRQHLEEEQPGQEIEDEEPEL